MSVIVFLGPSLSREVATGLLEARYLPPAAQGDVLRGARERPFAIGLIDGYFDHVPSVWHKELLWAIAQGIHVFGGSSMGALRAAELAPFGMRGIGRIFEAFQSEALEDDDEVAVVHGDAASGFRPLSEAMVNIRATLGAAVARRVVSADVAAALATLAKGLFYPERCYPRLMSQGLEAGLPAGEMAALASFVGRERVDLKAEDARAVLRALRECRAAGAPPAAVQFAFSHTEAWDQVLDWSETQGPLVGSDESAALDGLGAEIRLSARSAELLALGLARATASAYANRLRLPEVETRASRIDESLRGAPAPGGGSAFERWQASRDLGESRWRVLVSRQAAFEAVRERFADEVTDHAVDALRWCDDYPQLRERAREKADALRERGLLQPTLTDAGVSESEVIRWYFEDRLGRSVPTELANYLRGVGLSDVTALRDEALRELLYCRLRGDCATRRRGGQGV